MAEQLTEQQKAFLKALASCGISMNMLIAVGAVITTEPFMAEMSGRILKAEENGQTVTDGLVGQILTDMMMEATTDEIP